MTITDETLTAILEAEPFAGLPYARQSGFQPTVLIGPDARTVARFHQDGNNKNAYPEARARYAILACNNAAELVREVRVLRSALARFGSESMGWTVPPADDEHPYIARDADSGTFEASFTFGDMRYAARAAAVTPVTDDVKSHPPLYTMHTAELIADLDNTRLALRQREAEVARFRSTLEFIAQEQSAATATEAADKFQSVARAALTQEPGE